MEKLLEAVSYAHGLSFAAFRYFNAAGAAPDGSIGEDHDPEFSLIPLAIQTALGIRKELTIYGTDYPTPGFQVFYQRCFLHEGTKVNARGLGSRAVAGGTVFFKQRN